MRQPCCSLFDFQTIVSHDGTKSLTLLDLALVTVVTVVLRSSFLAVLALFGRAITSSSSLPEYFLSWVPGYPTQRYDSDRGRHLSRPSSPTGDQFFSATSSPSSIRFNTSSSDVFRVFGIGISSCHGWKAAVCTLQTLGRSPTHVKDRHL